MNESNPAPVLQIFFIGADVFKPALIEKANFTVRVRTMQKRRRSIDDAPQQLFGGTCWRKLACIVRCRIGLVSGGLWQIM
jgi:hypothetical protein